MVIAHHLIWTAYGWWLPNDPRGSNSHAVASDVIAQLGELHYGRKRIQPMSREIRKFYDSATKVLKFPLLKFAPTEIEAIAKTLESSIQHIGYTCYACAIMPDHVHLILRKHRHQAEDMTEALQESTRIAIIEAGRRHFDHPVWGGCGYKVFLDTPEDVHRTIRYIENNPVKIGRPVQRWQFVKSYDNWPFHKRQP